MKTQTKINDAKITARIAELQATPDALVGSDEGTHQDLHTFRLYESVTGDRYAIKSYNGHSQSTCSAEHAESATEGRMMAFPKTQSEIRAKARELAQLQKQQNV